MKSYVILVTVGAISLTPTGCGFARYSKLQVQVVDQQTAEGISKAQLRTYYIKTTLDFTYQRKDEEKTDREGFATLTIATNNCQWTILGQFCGIIPQISVEADGYRPRHVWVEKSRHFNPTRPLRIQMEKRDESPNKDGAANRSQPVQPGTNSTSLPTSSRR
jgi:hypothetical protein